MRSREGTAMTFNMADAGFQTFIIVKYGDNQEAIFNPWCSTYTLLEWIRRKCECEEDITLDLVDLEGQVKNLSSSSEEYASDFVNGRETYILIRVDKQGDNGPHRYVSLLNNLDEYSPDLMVKLNNLSRPTTRSRKDNVRRNARSNRKSAKSELSTKRPFSGDRRSKQGK